jgi:hypothetical protein
MGGGSSTQSAPTGYQPTWQAGADQGYQSLLQNATPWVTNLPGTVLPQGGAITNNITNNPYASSALSGATGVANTAAGAAGSMGANAGALNQIGAGNGWLNDYQLGTLGQLGMTASQIGTDSANLGYSAQSAVGQAVNAGNNVYRETQGMIPSTTQGAGYANPMLAGALSMIPGATAGMGAAGQILNTAFDPQGALYDRTMQSTLDTQNAINAMNGVSGSGYGAGLTGDAARNFNIDWQNNQLQREISGLGAFGQQQANVANNYVNLSNAGVNQYDALTGQAVSNLDALASTGFNAKNAGINTYLSGVNLALQGQNQQLAATNAQAGYTNDQVANSNALNNNTAGLYQSAADLQKAGLQTGLQASQLPYDIYLGQQQNAMGGLSALSQLYGSALQPTSGLGQMYGNYMNIGQNATSIAQNGVAQNNQLAEQNQSAIGSMLGNAASMAMMFF